MHVGMPPYSLQDAQVTIIPVAEGGLQPTESDKKLCDLVLKNTFVLDLDLLVVFILGCPLLTLAQKADCLTIVADTERQKHNSALVLFEDTELEGFTEVGLQLLESALPLQTT